MLELKNKLISLAAFLLNKERTNELKPITGIYIIEHRYNKKIYIGSSKNILKRIAQHRKALLLGTHHNSNMQRDFDLYDRIDMLFSYRTLKELNNNVPDFYLHSIEQMYIDRYSKTVQLYNIATPSKYSGMTWLTMKIMLFKSRIGGIFD